MKSGWKVFKIHVWGFNVVMMFIFNMYTTPGEMFSKKKPKVHIVLMVICTVANTKII